MHGPQIVPFTPQPLPDLLARLNHLPHLACFDIDRRYTAIVAEPLATFASDGAMITTTVGDTTRIQIDHPFDALQRFAARFPDVPCDPYLPFYAGLVGAVSFEWGAQHTHHVTRDAIRSLDAIPEAWFGWYDTAVILDHRESNAYIVSLGLTADGAPSAQHALRRIEHWLALMADPVAPTCSGLQCGEYDTIPMAPAYTDAAHGAVRLLQQGVAERVNFATCYQRVLPISALDALLHTRALHPAHATMYMDIGSHQLCASAPSTLLDQRSEQLALNPVLAAGHHQTARSAADWLAHTPGTVGLHHRMAAEIAPLLIDGTVRMQDAHVVTDHHVDHVISPVTGTLQPAYNMLHALAAIVPGLSMTGSPKPAALRVLTHCEPVRRNAYTGAMGFIGVNQRAQFSLSVRLLTMRDQIGTVHAANWLTPQTDAGAQCEQSHHAVHAFFQRLAQPVAQPLRRV